MTKPLPTGYLKDNSDISWQTFNNLLGKVNSEDEIGDLFEVVIMFDFKNATKENLVFNEIYLPIIEKKETIDPCERSVFKLLEQYKEGDSDNPIAYCSTKKAHTRMLKKCYSNVSRIFGICNQKSWLESYKTPCTFDF